MLSRDSTHEVPVDALYVSALTKTANPDAYTHTHTSRLSSEPELSPQEGRHARTMRGTTFSLQAIYCSATGKLIAMLCSFVNASCM